VLFYLFLYFINNIIMAKKQSKTDKTKSTFDMINKQSNLERMKSLSYNKSTQSNKKDSGKSSAKPGPSKSNNTKNNSAKQKSSVGQSRKMTTAEINAKNKADLAKSLGLTKPDKGLSKIDREVRDRNRKNFGYTAPKSGSSKTSSYLQRDPVTGKLKTPGVVSSGRLAQVTVKPKVNKKPAGSKTVSANKPAMAKAEPNSMKVPGVTMSGATINESIVLKPRALQMIETGSTTPSELVASKMPEATAAEKKGLMAKIKDKVNERRLAKIEKLKGKVAENNVMKKGGIKKYKPGGVSFGEAALAVASPIHAIANMRNNKFKKEKDKRDFTNSRGTRTQIHTDRNNAKYVKVTEKGTTIPGKTIKKTLKDGSSYSFTTKPQTVPGRVTNKVISSRGTAIKTSPASGNSNVKVATTTKPVSKTVSSKAIRERNRTKFSKSAGEKVRPAISDLMNGYKKGGIKKSKK
jgi:hypothetical protein